jgi:hypothetical protein
MRAASPLAPALLLAALAVAVYARAIGFDFVSYDDLVYVVENPNLRHGLSIEGIRRALLPYEHNWLPATFLSLLVDFAIYGPHPAGFHATNLLLHAASSALLFAALERLTRARGASFFTAAVFALHPLHVESVAWISERKDALAGFCFALALLAYSRAPAGGQRRGGIALALCHALGVLSKPLLVTLPCVLLLLDDWPLGRLRDARGRLDARRVRAALSEKLPLFGISACSSLITWEIQRATGAVDTLAAIPFGIRAENALVSYAAYLRDAVWPARLAVFYPHPLGSLPPREVLGAALLLGALSALALVARRRVPALLTGWLWYLGTLVPMIGLVQVGLQARADRYMYLPLIGLSIGVAYPLAELARRAPRARRALAGAAACALAALAWGTHRQLDAWRDSISLYERAIAVTSDNALAHYGLAGALAGGASLPLVREQLEATLRARPGWLLPAQRLIALRAAEAGIARARRALEGDRLEEAGAALRIVADTGYAPPELALLGAELARRRGDSARAAELLSQALERAVAARDRAGAEALRRAQGKATRAAGSSRSAPR